MATCKSLVLSCHCRFQIFSKRNSRPSKAIAMWLQQSDLQHCQVIGAYFHYSGGASRKSNPADALRSAPPSTPIDAYVYTRSNTCEGAGPSRALLPRSRFAASTTSRRRLVAGEGVRRESERATDQRPAFCRRGDKVVSLPALVPC